MSELCKVAGIPDQRHTALQDALGQFLDKQRDAVGAFCDLVNHRHPAMPCAGDLLNQRGLARGGRGD